MAQADYDRLAQGLPHDDYLAAVGAYQASRRWVDLVDTLITKAEQANERTRDNTEHERNHRDFVGYASPYQR